MLKRINLIPHKPSGAPVQYFYGSPFTAQSYIGGEIISILQLGLAQPSDIFILTASLKSKNPKVPIRQLENYLVENEVPVYVPTNEDAHLNPSVIEGKITFSTFHQCKGLERRIAIVFGFEMNYFVYYARDADPYICPNTLYVAATRAQDLLCIIGEDESKENQLPFLDNRQLQRLAQEGVVNLNFCDKWNCALPAGLTLV